jgi:hypothetical protein
MSNHYHLVLHVNKEQAKKWDNDKVIQRWLRLYKGPVLIQRYLQGELPLKLNSVRWKKWWKHGARGYAASAGLWPA